MVQGINIQFPSIREIYEDNKGKMLNPASPEVSFSDILKQSISKINDDFVQADNTVTNFLAGEGDIQDVLMAVQKVNMEFRLAVQIRNKLIEAYQEIMRMSI